MFILKIQQSTINQLSISLLIFPYNVNGKSNLKLPTAFQPSNLSYDIKNGTSYHLPFKTPEVQILITKNFITRMISNLTDHAKQSLHPFINCQISILQRNIKTGRIGSSAIPYNSNNLETKNIAQQQIIYPTS